MSDRTACVFCDIIHGKVSAHNIWEDDHSLVFLDKRPLFPGHCLLVPKLHIQELSDLPQELIEPLFGDAKKMSIVVREALGCHGIFLAINNNVSQSVPHLHIHIVPRNQGDGLKGFFWPRTAYRDQAHAEAIARQLIDTANKLKLV